VGLGFGLTVSACSGGGATTSLPFSIKAQQACQASAKKIAALGPLPTASTTATAAYVDANVRLQTDLVERLQSYARPKASAAQIGTWLDLTATALEAQTQFAKALRSQNAAAITLTLAGATKAAETANAAAEKLGLTECSHPLKSTA
jgi:hypothetical protein